MNERYLELGDMDQKYNKYYETARKTPSISAARVEIIMIYHRRCYYVIPSDVFHNF